MQNITQKTTDRATRAPLKTGDELQVLSAVSQSNRKIVEARDKIATTYTHT
jgi:hypothetical protein